MENKNSELKNTRLARAENLPAEIKARLGIESGLVIIETWNPDLRENFKAIGNGGMREYLLSLGDFKDVPIE